MPCHFDQNPQNGDLLIPDLHAIVTIYGAENVCGAVGRQLRNLGEGGLAKFSARYVAGRQVHHAARRLLVQSGNIYVVEWIAEGRVTKLKKI